MKLHPVIHNHNGILWCGHAAMAAITGRTSKDCLHYLKQSAKDLSLHGPEVTRRLKGIYESELTRALNYFAYDCKLLHHSRIYNFEKLPDNSLIDNVKKFRSPHVIYLAVVPNHFVVFQRDIVIDNSYPRGIRINDYPRKDQETMALWEVTQLQAGDL